MIDTVNNRPDFLACVDFASTGGLYFADPMRVITASTIDEVVPALAAVERESREGRWAVGYVAYGAAPAFDPALRVSGKTDLPLLAFGIFASPIPAQGTDERDAHPTTGVPHYWGGGAGAFDVSDWSTSLMAAEHAAGVDRIREAIAGGYTYQVNYTMRMRAAFDGDDYALYERLRRSQRAPYAAYLRMGQHRILSASPELFFHRCNCSSDRIVTRPMKGTAARGRWSQEDRERRDWLASSEKNLAENVMIVDLLRNDLGRIAEVGSVKVDELFKVEAYPNVFQMTSEISASLKPDTSLVDIFRALFPCGSVTGAPKISTMALIADLEMEPRGVYCGAIGYLAPSGEAIFNVAIRTAVVDIEAGVAEYGTGGGVTWDSDAADEFREAAAKAAILRDELPAFDLLETFCLRDGAYVLLERHFDRLLSSAEYFGFDIDEKPIRARLAEYAVLHPAGAYRVRLLVSQSGPVTIEGYDLGEPPSTAFVAVADEAIDSGDRFLYHKTTHRTVYERRKKGCPKAFDVLLWNERGEATEFTIGNVVAEIDGAKWTPPVECGLLPGTMRADLLATGQIEERVLSLTDIRRASRLWLVNSVRGWVRVTLGDF